MGLELTNVASSGLLGLQGGLGQPWVGLARVLCRIRTEMEGPGAMLTQPLRCWSVTTGPRRFLRRNPHPSQLPGGVDRTCMLTPSLLLGEAAEGQGPELGLSHLHWERGLRGKLRYRGIGTI